MADKTQQKVKDKDIMERRSIILVQNMDTGAPVLVPLGPPEIVLEILTREVQRDNFPVFLAGGHGL